MQSTKHFNKKIYFCCARRAPTLLAQMEVPLHFDFLQGFNCFSSERPSLFVDIYGRAGCYFADAVDVILTWTFSSCKEINISCLKILPPLGQRINHQSIGICILTFMIIDLYFQNLRGTNASYFNIFLRT